MLNIKCLLIIVLLGFVSMSYSQQQENNQVYKTYRTDSIPYHLLIIDKDKLIIEIPRNDAVTFRTSAVFITRTEKDTITIFNKLADHIKQEGIVIKNHSIDHFINQFIKAEIYKKSNNELLFIKKNRPYFKKELVDSVIGDNTIYYINDKLFKIPINSNEKLIDINKILKKPKRAKVKILKGKQAYEKYGIIGLNGVIEIFDKKKRHCRKNEVAN